MKSVADVVQELERYQGKTLTVYLRVQGCWQGDGGGRGQVPLAWARSAFTMHEVQVLNDGIYGMLLLTQDAGHRYRISTHALEVIPFNRGVELRSVAPAAGGAGYDQLETSLVIFFEHAQRPWPGQALEN